MMLGSPRIIAIDDHEAHLSGLADGLNRNGVACLKLHFTGDPSGFTECPDVRIVFADLHLGPGTPSDHKADFAVIGGLLENTIRPAGPYFIVLWTQYPDQAPELRRFLCERLGRGVTKPFDVCPLPKSDHIVGAGEIDDIKLMDAISAITRGMPEIGALFEWENQVLGAAGSTVSSILELASRKEGDGRANKVGRILGHLGVGAIGRDHVDRDRFRAVNEALVPILADHIANMPSGGVDSEIWRAALAIPAEREYPPLEEAARLNRLVHFADPGTAEATERGVVIQLPEPYRDDFEGHFGIEEKEAASKQFGCKEFDRNHDRIRWVLVQCRAACDYAQSQPGTVPFYLGLDLPEEHRVTSRKPPDATWCGPIFEFGDYLRRLRVSAGFPVAITKMIENARPIYRLREQILNDLVYHLHSHGARPGMISFGK